jgi:signal transduction histidine kinase
MTGRDVEVDADASTLVQVEPRLTSAALSHLIENALQYAPPDQPIVLRGWVESDGLRFTVTDRGPGLDPTELDHLFERFYRGRQTQRGTFGTGMGLAIARGLLAVESGRVWGENVDGGARFSIAVPSSSRRIADA